MFAARGGFLAQPSSTGFGNNGLWSSSANTSFYLSTTSTTNLITWTATTGFTIEYWFYAGTSLPSTINPGPGNHAVAGSSYWSFGPISTGAIELYFWTGSQNYFTTAASVVTTGAWNNIAFVATTSGSNTTMTFYVNGVRTNISLNSGTAASSITFASNSVAVSTSNPFLMGVYSPVFWTNMFINELRVSNINRYSGASYTLATSPFTSDANTQLLMHMDGANLSTTFTDSSSFNRTITNNSLNVYQTTTRANHT
jgi:hypothetical protein